MRCPWCGGHNIKHDVKQVMTAPYIYIEMNGEKVPMAAMAKYSECECGLLFQEHRQTDEWYEWFYSSGTYRDTLGIKQEEMDADERARACDLVEWIRVFDRINFKTHLDIGSSKGYFLDAAQKEFDCKVFNQELNETDKKYDKVKGKPELVSAIHVLEHLVDPVKSLNEWAELTSKYLLIETPGKNTIGGPLRFAHLYYFPPGLLLDKMRDLGFVIVGVDTEPNTRILAKKTMV